jgi:Head domain of trimeric autotransporter adhesin
MGLPPDPPSGASCVHQHLLPLALYLGVAASVQLVLAVKNSAVETRPMAEQVHPLNTMDSATADDGGRAGLTGSHERDGDPPMLGRKAVLIGMLTSGFVISNAAQSSDAFAGGTSKSIPTTRPTDAPRWTPITSYVLGQQVVSPNNDVVSATVAHNSSAAYDSDTLKWALSSTYVQAASDANNNTKGGGTSALAALTTGHDNTASGLNALKVNTSGAGCTAIGSNALAANTTGVTNIAVGWNALAANTTGACLIAIGTVALAANTTADDNTAVGSDALTANTTGYSNVAVGTWALTSNTTAAGNAAVGFNALKANTTGASNSALGTQALAANTTGYSNVAFGASALDANTTGNTNAAVGANALAANTTGASNVAVGEEAGYTPANVLANATVTGSRNTFIGYQSGPADATDPWQTVAVGWWATVSGQYAVAIGAGAGAKATGAVAIGTDSAGTGASTTTANAIALGTALHTTTILGRLVTAVGTTTKAGVNIPHGAAPTSPANGDVWSTTGGLFIQINGVTKTVTLT